MVDALALGASGVTRGGSSPLSRTMKLLQMRNVEHSAFSCFRQTFVSVV